MAGIEIQIKGLFATPVAAVILPDAEARNAELQDIILRHRAEHPSIGASNMGGWHSTRDLAEWGGKRAEEVLAFGRDLATKLTTDREGRAVRPEWTTEAWANVSGRGHSNACHYHPGSFWSGSYYVSDGGCADDPSLGGEFEMFDPRGRGYADDAWACAEMRRRSGLSAGGEGRTHSSARRADVLFPSFLLHAVRPYRGNGLRISVASSILPLSRRLSRGGHAHRVSLRSRPLRSAATADRGPRCFARLAAQHAGVGPSELCMARRSARLKHCPPFVDAMAHGFIIPLPCDVAVHDGKFSWSWDLPPLAVEAHPRSPLSFHVPAQVTGTPFHDPTRAVIKFNSFWTIELEAGISLFATHPVNRADLPFRLLTGLVNSDRFSDVGILFPAIWIDTSFQRVLPPARQWPNVFRWPATLRSWFSNRCRKRAGSVMRKPAPPFCPNPASIGGGTGRGGRGDQPVSELRSAAMSSHTSPIGAAARACAMRPKVSGRSLNASW